MTRLSQTIYCVHHPLPAAEFNRWGKWDKGWSMRGSYIQPPALHIFHPQHNGHLSLTSYPVHWFLLSNKSILLDCIFAVYPSSVPPSLAVLFLRGGEYNLISHWGVLSSQVQGDGRLGRLASAHFVFTGCYWALMNTKLQSTWGVWLH